MQADVVLLDPVPCLCATLHLEEYIHQPIQSAVLLLDRAPSIVCLCSAEFEEFISLRKICIKTLTPARLKLRTYRRRRPTSALLRNQCQ
jgi:hypothetical protein